MKRIIPFIALIAVFYGCSKEPDTTLFSYEFALTEQDGTSYKSSDYFYTDEKEDVTDEIYYEKGIYWAKGNEAKTELTGYFQLAIDCWEEYIGSEYIALSFSPYGGTATKSGTVGTRADEGPEFAPKDVTEFVVQIHDISDMFHDDMKRYGETEEYNKYFSEVSTAAVAFRKNPSLDSYKSVKKTIQMSTAKRMLMSISKGRDELRICYATQFALFKDLFQSYDKIFKIS